MTRKDKRPTKIYPDHRQVPGPISPEPTEEPADDVILPQPPQPPTI
jgi:hypothetical protein